MCGGNWRLVVILVVILTSCVDARTKILLHCFFSFWNTSSRLFVNQNPELSFERRIRTKTESFTHLSLSESVCLLSERVNQRELSVCQLVRLLVRLSVPSPSVYPSPQFQCVCRCFNPFSISPPVRPVMDGWNHQSIGYLVFPKSETGAVENIFPVYVILGTLWPFSLFALTITTLCRFYVNWGIETHLVFINFAIFCYLDLCEHPLFLGPLNWQTIFALF